MTQEYVERLVAAFPCIREVWLFGSRANDRAGPNSDWDYLVFSNDDRLLNILTLTPSLHDPSVDVLVVAAPDTAMAPPWDGSATAKMLSLHDGPGGMSWTFLSDREATYTQCKDRPGDPTGFATDMSRARAIRVYP